MPTVTIEEAQADLAALVRKLALSGEVVITENGRPVAKLLSLQPELTPGLRPPPGLGKGLITIVSDDDDHLQDFHEHMP